MVTQSNTTNENVTGDSCLHGWIKSEVYTKAVDTADELLARVLDAATRVKKREDQLRRTTRHLRTRDTSAM